MKRVGLGCFIVFLVFAACWDTRDYVLGNTLTDNDVTSYMVAGEYRDFEEASDMMRDGLSRKVGVISNYRDYLYKLPNHHYYILHMSDNGYKHSQYLYTGFMERKNANVTELTFPDHEFNLVSVNGKFKQKAWEIKSKAGVHRFKVGEFSNSDNLTERIVVSSDGYSGISLSSQLKKGVIQINNEGLWLDRGNNKVGMNNKLKAYPSEQAAVDGVKQDDFGKAVGVLKSDDMNFYIFKYQMDVFNAYAVIPVRLKDNEFYAGPYERFTFNKDDRVKSDFEERVDGVTYKLHFQNEQKKYKTYSNEIKDGKMQIAVEVRGAGHGK